MTTPSPPLPLPVNLRPITPPPQHARRSSMKPTYRLSKDAKRLEGEVASAARALRESPSTVKGTLKEAAATRRLLAKRSRKLSCLSAKQHAKEAATSATASPPAPAREHGGQVGAEAEAGSTAEEDKKGEVEGEEDDDEGEELEGEDEQKEEDEEGLEELEVEEGSVVLGAFDPIPELKSRLNDRKNSLRFVTADEEAQIRKEELAMVFSGRSSGSAAASGVSEEDGGTNNNNNNGGDGGGDDDTGGDAEEGEKTSADDVGSDSGLGGGRGSTRGRVKSFGAILESTLSKTLVPAPPPSRSTGPIRRASMSALPPRPGRETSDKKKAAIIAKETPWEPKSKYFRSLQSAAAAGDGNGGGKTGGSRSPTGGLPPPPPAPMLGMLSQIRARGNSNGGSRSTGCLPPPPPPPPPPAPMLGMLSEIRARGGGSARGVGGNQGGGSQAPAGMDGLLAAIRARRR
ncbi:unnamed protein product [Ectocarpus sp. 8 AP-2014]